MASYAPAVRKQLSADALFRRLRTGFADIADHRPGKPEIQQFPEFCPCYKRSSESVKSQSLSGFPNAPKIDSGRKNSLKIPRCSRRAKFYSLYFSMA
jgi:hypothetical protein